MGVILKNTSWSTYLKKIECEIIDTAGGSDAAHFDILAPGWSTEWLGNREDIFDYIIPSHSKCNIVLNTEEAYGFFNNMLTAEEGRFFVKIIVDESWSWVGKVIVEEMRLDDRLDPVFSFTAIDGLTDLKGIDYTPVTLYMSFKDILIEVFKKLTTYDYISSSNFMGFQSDIVPNVASYAGNLMAIGHLNNYFYKKENLTKRKFSCWQVLEEMMKRLNTNCRISTNIIWVTGLEGIHTTRVTNLHYYSNTGTFTASTGFLTTAIEIDNYALYGGLYTYNAGYKRVIIEADKIFSNRRLGDSIFWGLRFDTIMAAAYQTIGKAKADIKYKVRVNFNILAVTKVVDTDPLQPYFYVRMNLGVVAGALIATDKDYNLPTTPGIYYYEFIIESDASDREIQAKFDLEAITDTNLSGMAIDINLTMTETSQIYESIKTISTITGSKNPKVKTINIYGNHQNGGEAVKFYYATGGGDQEDTKQYKFSGGGSWLGYEQLIAEHLLKYSGNTEVIEIPYNRIITDDHTLPYSYEEVIYYPIGILKNYHLDTQKYTMIRVNGAQSGSITTEYEVPLSSDVNEVTTSTIGNIQLYVNLYHEEFENVTASYISPTTDLSEYFTGDVDEIKKGRMVWMNGVKQQYKDVAVVSYPPDPGELNLMQWTYFAATNRFYFGQPLEDCYVEFRFSNV